MSGDQLFTPPSPPPAPLWRVLQRNEWSTIGFPATEALLSGPAAVWWKAGGPHLLAVRYTTTWDEAAHLANIWVAACLGFQFQVGAGFRGLETAEVNSVYDGLLSLAATLERTGREVFEGAWEKALKSLDKTLDGYDPQNHNSTAANDERNAPRGSGGVPRVRARSARGLVGNPETTR